MTIRISEEQGGNSQTLENGLWQAEIEDLLRWYSDKLKFGLP